MQKRRSPRCKVVQGREGGAGLTGQPGVGSAPRAGDKATSRRRAGVDDQAAGSGRGEGYRRLAWYAPMPGSRARRSGRRSENRRNDVVLG